MHNRVWAFRLVALAGIALPAILLMALASCGGQPAGPPVSLDVGSTTSEVNTLILIAQEKGYFASNGVAVTDHVYASGVAGLQGLLDDDVQLVTGSEFALVGQVLAEKDICTIAAINRSSIEYLVARVDRGISSLSDLKGKTIGVPLHSRPEFALDRFLYFHNIEVSELTLVDVPVDQSVDALVSGKVDAIAAWQPYTNQAEERLRGKVIAWSVQEDQPSYTLVMSTAVWAAANRESISRFLRAMVEAEDYVTANPEAARDLLHEKWNHEQGYLASIWPEHRFSVLLDQALVVVMEDQARWIMERELAGEREMPDFVGHICAEGLEEVKPEAVSLIR